jgi:transcription elongation factor GreA
MSKTWLTQEAADRLFAELSELETTRRSEIVKKIEAARAEGDLKENGGYHAAREEQGKLEARIRQLKALLENAEIGTPTGEAGQVSPGMKVKVEIMGNQMEFLLGSREISTGDLDVYSEQSPLGSAVMGAKIGDTRSYTAPNGKAITVKVIAADFFA